MNDLKLEKPWLSPGQLLGSRDCSEYERISLMHLSREPDESALRREAVKTQILYALSERTAEGAVKIWEKFLLDIFDCLPGAMAAEKESTDFLVRRFLSWFYDQGFSVRRTGFNVPFDYLGKEIRVHVDLELLKRDGKVLWMNLSHSKSTCSERARNPVNSLSNCVPLLSMMAAAEECGLEADCCIAHLKAKDDRTEEKSPVFEKGKGKNLSLMTFSKGTQARLRQAMELTSAPECLKCRYRDVCRTGPLTEPEKEEKSPDLIEHFRKKVTLSSEDQQAVIDHRDGPCVVIAVAGAGKTRTLTERYLAMVKDGIPAERILFVTFTRKAAGELETRLRAVTKHGTPPESFTFHSLFTLIINEYGKEGMDAGRLATSTKRKKLIVKALSLCPAVRGLSYEFPELRFGAYDVLDGIFERFRREGIPATVPGFKGDMSELVRVYDTYRSLYETAGYFDYDDIVKNAGKLLRDPAVLQKVQERWQYIMVDEFQDVNQKIAENIYRMASGRQNLVVVGDDDQGIYGFNGGDSRHILEFRKNFPDAKCIYMEENYRSSPQILSCAQSLIVHNDVRYRKTLRAGKNKAGMMPEIIEDFSLSLMVEFMRYFHEYAPEEICILARRNSILETLAEKFGDAGIRCLPPRKYLIDTDEFGVLHCFLKLYVLRERCPDVYLYRLLRYCGATVREGPLYLSNFGDLQKIPECVSDALIEADRETGSVSDRLIRIFMALSGFEEKTTELSCLADRVDDEVCGDLFSVMTLFDEMVRYHDSSEVEVSEKKGYVNLVTSHKAKGKEYRCVMIYGIEDYDRTEEERRLLYVSMTRAKERLILIQTGEEAAPLLDEIEGAVPFELRKEA